MDPFLAQIVGFAGNFAPRGWAFCSGQLLAISSNSALFSLLGTMYGGDGRTTFALPDLRGRSFIHVGGTSGTGPGLSTYRIGERGGLETVTLSTTQMPSHNHTATLHGETAAATSANPNNKMLALTADAGNIYAAPVAAEDKTMASGSVLIQNQGGSQPHENRSPFLGCNFIIATQGTFPSRS